MVTPNPQDPRLAGPSAETVESTLHEILSRPADNLAEEAVHLEEAYRILNDALA